MLDISKIQLTKEEQVYVNLHETMTIMYDNKDERSFHLAEQLLKKPGLPKFFQARCHMLLGMVGTGDAVFHAGFALVLLEEEQNKFLTPDPMVAEQIKLARKMVRKAKEISDKVLQSQLVKSANTKIPDKSKSASSSSSASTKISSKAVENKITGSATAKAIGASPSAADGSPPSINARNNVTKRKSAGSYPITATDTACSAAPFLTIKISDIIEEKIRASATTETINTPCSVADAPLIVMIRSTVRYRQSRITKANLAKMEKQLEASLVKKLRPTEPANKKRA